MLTQSKGRGVGKTELALQFAYTNPAKYDAIFWIQCETSVAIRQSFTNVAIALNLPGAYKDGRKSDFMSLSPTYVSFSDLS